MVPELIQLKDLLKISDSLFTYHERLEGMEYSRHVFFEKKLAGKASNLLFQCNQVRS